MMMDSRNATQAKCAVFGLLVVLSLVAGGCASSSGIDASNAASTEASVAVSSWSDATTSSFPDEVTDLADRLIATHGAEAPLVLFRAIDRGYDPDQLAAGIRSESIDATGAIADVEPNRPAGDVLGTTAGVGEAPVGMLRPFLFALLQGDSDGLIVDEVRTFFGGAGERADLVLVSAIIALHSNGYSLEQIVNAIVLGEGVPGDYRGCLVVPFEGTNVRPAYPQFLNPCNDDAVTLDSTATSEAAREDEPSVEDESNARVFAASFAPVEYETTSRMVETLENHLLVDLSGPSPTFDGVFHFSWGQPETFAFGEVCLPEIRFVFENTVLEDAVERAGTWTGSLAFSSENLLGTCTAAALEPYMTVGFEAGIGDVEVTVSGDDVSGSIIEWLMFSSKG